MEKNAPLDFRGHADRSWREKGAENMVRIVRSQARRVGRLYALTALVAAIFALVPLSAQGQSTYELRLSLSPDRSGAVALAGSTVSGKIYVFTSPDANVVQVRFFLDDPTMSGTPRLVEKSKPFDFDGTNKDGTAKPFDTATLANGSHTITAALHLSDATTQVVSATFTVNNRRLVLSQETASFAVEFGGSGASKALEVATNDAATVPYTASDNATWLTVSPTSGTTPQTLTLRVDPAGLAVGTYKATLTVSAAGYVSDTLPVELTVQGKLLVSASADRSSARPLEHEEVWSTIYIFVKPDSGISEVSFFIDDPSMTGLPDRIETLSPWDLAGGTASAANPFDTTTLTDGTHTITARIKASAGGTHTVASTFSVINGAPALTSTPDPVTFRLDPGQTDSRPVDLATSNGSATAFAVTEDVPWLTVTPTSGTTTPATLDLAVETAGLGVGTYTGAVKVTAPGYRSGTLLVQLRLGCPPLPCSEALVSLPYELEFDQDHGKILDGSGIGTGFTWIDEPSKSTGYIAQNLAVDPAVGTLRITTTKGLQYASSNSLDNGLAVGIDAPSQTSVVSARLLSPPAGTGKYEQAGIWFGNNEDNYTKLVVNSAPEGVLIEHLMEVNGTQAAKRTTGVLDLTGATVDLSLFADPVKQTISAFYRINGGNSNALGVFTPPPEFFSFDGARIDPRIGTDSFGGIFASHRNGSQLTYTFDYFGVVKGVSSTPPSSQGIKFARTSFDVPFPTSLAWGPDGRIYVTELFGKIHAITLGSDKRPIDDEVITTLGTRLTLGIAIDPASTANNVILWVSHSDPSLDNGQINSSMVSRLSGPEFTTREDVITGLPRAKANHAVNSIHFGPDGRLYIAVGGNTGAGGRDSESSGEFGDRQEQPLSAALVVADVKSSGFDGSCNNATDPYGPPPCDVVPFATGLRNTYDFVFHSNGSIYGPDNGLGVSAVMPPSTTPPCTGFGTQDPGPQPDPLHRIVQGKYYGHPNPSRNECVFFDGSRQGVAPLPNWMPAMFDLGDHRSANGTIEYTADAFCGALRGELLIANYSVGDDITRVKLADDGLSVVSAGSLVGGFNDPLPLVQGPDGTIYVGEAGGGSIAALTPVDLGCWTARQDLPVALLDAGGAAVGGKLYVAGGKTNAGHQSKMHVYDPTTDTWTAAPDLPGAAVENPALVALNGKLYAFGGSTAAFSGAVSNAAVFDPAAGTWTALPPMPTARSGAPARAIGGKIYVVGGMGGDGGSLTTVEVFDPATNTWTSAAPMATRRDNPGAAGIDGKLYVFGGRTRDADGTTIDGTLASGEVYDPATDTWSAIAPMPTGRRTMVVGTLNGRAQLIGGEITTDGKAFAENEEYDPVTNSWRSLKSMPTARHGAAAGTIDGVIHVVGGGPVGGLSFTAVNEAFAFGN
jgi:large repetitive protein